MDGWLILDKPLGISSAQAVGAVKRLLKPRKIGHGGTLDPLASGILPLALGEATKTFDYLVAHEKGYRFTVRWGEARTTDDAEGAVTQQSTARPEKSDIEAILAKFQGIIEQRPPAYSAISMDGQRAYARARAGEAVVLAARPVEILSLQLLEILDNDHAVFELVCGKGTYVRSLARDMGEMLGCFGYVSALRRIRVGKFTEKTAISLDSLKEVGYTPTFNLPLLAIEDVLDDIPAVFLDALQATRLRQGQSLTISNAPQGILRCHGPDSKLLAMGKMQGNQLMPVRVFNL